MGPPVLVALVLLGLTSSSSALGMRMPSAVGECKTVYFIRHGQAEHNILFESNQASKARVLLDPPLTTLGLSQAERLRADLLLSEALADTKQEAPLLLVSPLRRTLQETGEVPCDTGSPLSEVQKLFVEDLDILDFSEVSEGWQVKEGLYRDTGDTLKARIARFEAWLSKRPEKSVVLVAHHNVFLAMLKVSFMNCEVRKYRFDPHATGTGCWLALEPKISERDDELEQTSLRHEQMYHAHNKQKLQYWGISLPERFR